jgi:hypothetical protein
LTLLAPASSRIFQLTRQHLLRQAARAFLNLFFGLLRQKSRAGAQEIRPVAEPFAGPFSLPILTTSEAG